ncbi:4-hydroxy-tetrahydrodipicolinate synthase [Leptolyngbya sp. FACHB-261]|uniref:4-hydroxy-tetrahydrodipicolinate synthase n=1 Tax=Leptolyngbya sp. FACHB-261 TaxID=2692806 RepID=UPI0016895385|nr:4-hydroxy-tetrahydrodipicolinate synthase [Leptolyngbya sp. FACHB-261]MBD2101297.1 4-hydroxy-tetrahydrodipicolinate synthase [Leptolyngbya sp. FACHB-261]
MADFGRVLTAMVTPFTEDGEVNYTVVRELAIHLVNHGTDTLVVCGTTGESPTLTWDEEYKLFQVIREAVSGNAKVMAGTGSNSTREAIIATEKAAKLELDGTLQVVPYYNKPPQEGLYQHFKAIAQASDLPMMLYNIPGRTGCNLEPETVARLAEVPGIVAIKEASGNLDQVSQIRRLTPATFDIYSGDDSLTLPMMAVGAKGVVSVASHLVGDKIQQMVQAFNHQPKQATQLHLELLPLFKVLFITTNPIMVKAALHLQGWSVGNVRPPLSTISGQHSEILHSVLSELSLI